MDYKDRKKAEDADRERKNKEVTRAYRLDTSGAQGGSKRPLTRSIDVPCSVLELDIDYEVVDGVSELTESYMNANGVKIVDGRYVK